MAHTDRLINVISKVRETLIANSELFGKVSDRVYPQKVDLNSDPVFPLVSYTLLGGSSDKGYDSNVYEFQFAYISTASLDEAVTLYEITRQTLDNNKYSSSGINFIVSEGTIPIDGTAEYANRFLYLYTNTYEIRVLG